MEKGDFFYRLNGITAVQPRNNLPPAAALPLSPLAQETHLDCFHLLRNQTQVNSCEKIIGTDR
jgi:hypothetical protein